MTTQTETKRTGYSRRHETPDARDAAREKYMAKPRQKNKERRRQRMVIEAQIADLTTELGKLTARIRLHLDPTAREQIQKKLKALMEERQKLCAKRAELLRPLPPANRAAPTPQ